MKPTVAASPRVFRARWVWTGGHTLLRDAELIVEGGIIREIGTSRTSALQSAEVINLPNALLMPGLVNAHTHLWLSRADAASAAGKPFVEWIGTVRERAAIDLRDAASLADSARYGLAQCARFGITCVGDITAFCPTLRPVLRDSGIRCVSFGEALGLGGARDRFEKQLNEAIDPTWESARLRIGLQPHSPYTVEADGLSRCLQMSQNAQIPLSVHLAEVPEEVEFTTRHRGPLRELWEALGSWRDGIPCPGLRPIEYAEQIGLLRHPTVLAHVNECSDAELKMLAAGRASVVHCPRTHSYFGRNPHPWRRMLERGINVAVGTDSCASSPDLNLMADARELRRLNPDFPAHQLLEMITIRAARALGWDKEIGRLASGFRADLVAFPVESDDPLEEVLRRPVLPVGCWIDGLKHPCATVDTV